MSAPNALKEIVQKKKERIAQAKLALPQEELKARVEGMPATRPFLEAISKPRTISLIAEIKKASPSGGVIRQDFDHTDIARAYEEAQVQAISVLTEEDHFLGSAAFINDVKAVTTVPVLRKDFILENYQVLESRFYGADAILLIADLLSKDAIAEMSETAAGLGMDCLVEVHNEKELKKILNMKISLIGINNRDLHTLEVDLKTTERLFPLIPKGNTVVVESGIKSSQDVLFLRILGASAVLIGQAFMEAADIRRKVEELMGW
ncbi:MAG TPA: indole-3-glycerol phosphate synthase TrpC [Patescibacteria group bacterium]|nr:indole-3-glycerol phosphate synthase TrpC [Patescibacteria group bacterium]